MYLYIYRWLLDIYSQRLPFSDVFLLDEALSEHQIPPQLAQAYTITVVCTLKYTYICKYVCMYVYTCMYVCIYTHR